MGGTFLFVNAGSQNAPPVPPDGTIAGREPFEMADLMQQMSDTVGMVNETISALRGDVESAVSDVAQTANKANALLTEVSDDVAAISASGKRIMADTQAIVADLQQGHGTVGKLLKDDEVYQRVTATARQAQIMVEEARKAVQQGRQALENLQAKDGPTQGMAADLRATLGHARSTLATWRRHGGAQAQLLLPGFFKDRGYDDLRAVSPAEYQRGVLEGDKRQALRIWLRAGVLFATTADGTEDLTPGGRARLDSAMAAFLPYVADAPLVVEGVLDDGRASNEYIAGPRARGAGDRLPGLAVRPCRESCGADGAGCPREGQPGWRTLGRSGDRAVRGPEGPAVRSAAATGLADTGAPTCRSAIPMSPQRVARPRRDRLVFLARCDSDCRTCQPLRRVPLGIRETAGRNEPRVPRIHCG